MIYVYPDTFLEHLINYWYAIPLGLLVGAFIRLCFYYLLKLFRRN